MMRSGYSPWGKTESCRCLCEGVLVVVTEGHGGIMVDGDAARRLLSPAARKCGFRHSGYLCFEKECDAPVVLQELLDRGLMPWQIECCFQFEELSAELEECLQDWHPEYWRMRQRAFVVRQKRLYYSRKRAKGA